MTISSYPPVESVTVNGEEVEAEIEMRWGIPRVLLPGLNVDEAMPLTIEVKRDPAQERNHDP